MSQRHDAPVFEVGDGVYVVSPEGKLLLAEQERAGRRNWGSFGGGIEHGESIRGVRSPRGLRGVRTARAPRPV